MATMPAAFPYFIRPLSARSSPVSMRPPAGPLWLGKRAMSATRSSWRPPARACNRHKTHSRTTSTSATANLFSSRATIFSAALDGFNDVIAQEPLHVVVIGAFADVDQNGLVLVLIEDEGSSHPPTAFVPTA